MEIRVLKYFLAVARCENITRAAEELHLTQPTLSRQLTDLELELGKQLLIRGKRKITLTEEGRFLKARAEEIIMLADKTEAQIRSNDEQISGDVYIGCGETEAMREISKVLAEVRQAYPDIRFHMVSGNSELITDWLNKGLLDFGLLCRQTPPVEYVYRQLNYKDSWGLLVREDNKLAAKSGIEREDLFNEPLIISRQIVESQEFDHWLNKPVKELNIAATYNLLHNTLFMAEQGIGSVLGFNRIISENSMMGSGLKFIPLSPPIYSSNYLIWRKRYVFSKAGAVVKAYFEKVFPNKYASKA